MPQRPALQVDIIQQRNINMKQMLLDVSESRVHGLKHAVT